MNKPNHEVTIAAIGDSVTAGFHVDSDMQMFFRLWSGVKKSWFSKIVKNFPKKIKIQAVNYSTPGSKVIGTTWLDRLTNQKSVSGQVDALLSRPKFPNMVLIWAGHSVLDWSVKPEQDFNKITNQFHSDFKKQLERLCETAIKQDYKAVIVVFGFINIRALFKLREMAAKKKESRPALFPYFEKGYKIFKSIRPEFKEKTIELADRINLELESIVLSCQKKYGNKNIQLLYSEALSEVSTDSLDCVTAYDGWHPSQKGQSILAEAAWPVIKKQLDFLLGS